VDKGVRGVVPVNGERERSSLAIHASGLSKSYHGRVAVDSVDLEARAGTVLGLLGPNGAGKTTVIRMLSTVLRPDAGTFAIAGVAHTDPSEIRRRIGVLPEGAGFPRSQTCEEGLAFHGRLYGAGRGTAN